METLLRNKYKDIQFIDLSNSLFYEGNSIQTIIAPFLHWKLVERDSVTNEILLRKPRSYFSSEDAEHIILCGAIAEVWLRAQQH